MLKTGLQIQCGALHGVPGGFDSHAPPPMNSNTYENGLFCPQVKRGHFFSMELQGIICAFSWKIQIRFFLPGMASPWP